MNGDEQARSTADAVARHSYGKLVAFLAARSRDVAAAEDALADAFAAALADWPARGVPRNPEAWLLTTARRKLIDAKRRRRTAQAAVPDLERAAELLSAASDEEGDDVTIPDQRLALMFACTHPAIDASVRAPLILQTVLGFDAALIASAFLASPTATSASTCGRTACGSEGSAIKGSISASNPSSPATVRRSSRSSSGRPAS